MRSPVSKSKHARYRLIPAVLALALALSVSPAIAVDPTLSGTVRDEAGYGISGVTVKLVGGPGGTVTTPPDGKYSFTIPAGTAYTVTPSKPGYVFSPPSRSGAMGASNISNQDFLGQHTLSGKVQTAAGVGIGGVLVVLTGGQSAALTTGANGLYTFTIPLGAAYTVTPSKPGYTFTPASYSGTMPPSNIIDRDFVGSGSASILGQITDPAGAGIAGVSITDGAGHTATTAADGSYKFEGLTPGSYRITPSLLGWAFSPAYADVNASGTPVRQDFTGSGSSAISGLVTDSSTPPRPLEGVQISAGAGHTAMTDASGGYTIGGLVPGTYTLTASQGGRTSTPSSLTVTVPPSQTGQDFQMSPYRVFFPIIRRPFSLANGDFESGLVGWARDPASALPTSIATSDARSPTHSLLLGDPGYPYCSQSVPVGFARVTRQIQLPDLPGLTISFWYHIVSQDQMRTTETRELVDTFEFAVNGGSPMLQDGSNQATGCDGPAADLGWKLYHGSLDQYRGQNVTLSFTNYSREPTEPGATLAWYNTYVFVDDVGITAP